MIDNDLESKGLLGLIGFSLSALLSIAGHLKEFAQLPAQVKELERRHADCQRRESALMVSINEQRDRLAEHAARQLQFEAWLKKLLEDKAQLKRALTESGGHALPDTGEFSISQIVRDK